MNGTNSAKTEVKENTQGDNTANDTGVPAMKTLLLLPEPPQMPESKPPPLYLSKLPPYTLTHTLHSVSRPLASRVVNRKNGHFVGATEVILCKSASRSVTGYKVAGSNTNATFVQMELNKKNPSTATFKDSGVKRFKGDARLFLEAQSNLAKYKPTKPRKVVDPTANKAATGSKSAVKSPSSSKPVSTTTGSSGGWKKKTFADWITECLLDLDKTSKKGTSVPAIIGWLAVRMPGYDINDDKSVAKLKTSVGLSLKQQMSLGEASRFVKVKASYLVNPTYLKAMKAKDKKRKENEKKRAQDGERARRLKALEESERRAAEARGEIYVPIKMNLEGGYKRRYPMDDLKLVREDIVFQHDNGLPKRPIGEPAFGGIVPNSFIPDVIFIFNVFRGGLGFSERKTPEFSPEQLCHSLNELDGDYCKARLTFPPLLIQLFTTALRSLVEVMTKKAGDGESPTEEDYESEESLSDLDEETERVVVEDVDDRYLFLRHFIDYTNPLSWTDILVHYLQTQENYHKKQLEIQDAEAKRVKSTALSCIAPPSNNSMDIDSEEDYGDSDEDEEEEEQDVPVDDFFGSRRGPLYTGFTKLKSKEAWTLNAKEAVTLLRVVTDDVLSKCLPREMARRASELETTTRNMRKAVFHATRIRGLYERAQEKSDDNMTAAGTDEPEKARAASVSPVPDANRNKNVPLLKDVQAAEKARKHAEAEYRDAEKGNRVRHVCLGLDRDKNSYWYFENIPNLLFCEHSTRDKSWSVYTKVSEFDAMVSSLDVRGKRELDLHNSLTAHADSIRGHLNNDILTKKRAEEEQRLKRKIAELEKVEEARRTAALMSDRRSVRAKTAESTTDPLAQLKRELDLCYGSNKNDHLEELSDDPKERRKFLTGVASCLAFDNNDRKIVRHRADKPLESHKVTSIVNDGVVKVIVEELLAAEDKLNKYSPNDDEAARLEWRKGLREIAADFEEARVDGYDSDGIDKAAKNCSIKSLGAVLKPLKAPLLELEGRMFDISGSKWVDECEALAAKIDEDDLPGVEDEDDDDNDEDEGTRRGDEGSQVTEEEDDVDSEEEEEDYLTPSAFAVGAAMKRGGARDEWRRSVQRADTLGKFSALMYGFLAEYKKQMVVMKTRTDTCTAIWPILEKLLKKGKRAEVQDATEAGEKIWCRTRLTDRIVWAKMDLVPWWPCIVKEPIEKAIQKQLKRFDVKIISFFGETNLHLLGDDWIKDMFDENGKVNLPPAQYGKEGEWTGNSKDDLVVDDNIESDLEDAILLARKVHYAKSKRVR